MKLLRPVEITDTSLISSTVAETEYSAWSAATTYTITARVTYAHRIFESLQNTNLNHTPTSTTNTWWVDVGPTNRWAMFDKSIGTATNVSTTQVSVVIHSSTIVTSLAILDLYARDVTVTVRDGPGGPIVYTSNTVLVDQNIIHDWYEYFYLPISIQSNLLLLDIPPYGNAYITVDINAVSSVSCGTFIIGNTIELGTEQTGITSSIIDYSTKETDVFGVTTLLKRTFSKKVDVPILIYNQDISYISRKLAEVRAVPCVWIVNTEIYPMLIYGFYRDWNVNIQQPVASEVSIYLEGLT